MANQKVKCENEKCKKVFSLHVKVGPEVDGRFEVYFICPHCNKHYSCYYENKQTMSIQDQINNYNEQLKATRTIKKIDDFKKEFNKIQGYIKKIDKLRKDKRRLLEKINLKNKLFKKK